MGAERILPEIVVDFYLGGDLARSVRVDGSSTFVDEPAASVGAGGEAWDSHRMAIVVAPGRRLRLALDICRPGSGDLRPRSGAGATKTLYDADGNVIRVTEPGDGRNGAGPSHAG
jgi:hypothetical protein